MKLSSKLSVRIVSEALQGVVRAVTVKALLLGFAGKHPHRCLCL